ncbi:MAG: CheR family methyltransferase [Pseudomonadota bacterium]
MMLQNNPDEKSREFDTLVSELTIGETHFFRDEKLFDGIRDVVLPSVIKKNSSMKRLWIWSAGCATGEEAYTISILINRHFSHLLKDWDLRITGTDINRNFLHRALTGDYTDWSFRGTSEDIRQACFVRNGSTWHIKPEYRNNVSFQYHNLIKMPFPSVIHNLFCFDIIFCRNVMIYFDSATIQRLIRQFQEALVPDGWLVVGHADHNIRYFGSFQTIMLPGTSFYQNTVHDVNVADKGLKLPRLPVFRKSDNPYKVYLPDYHASQSSTPGQEKADVFPQDKEHRPSCLMGSGGLEQKADGRKSTGLDTLTGLINQGKWDEASLVCDTLYRTTSPEPTLYLLSAFILEQKGYADDAVAELRKALYLDRKFVIGHYHLGLVYQNLGELKKAEKSFNNVVKLLKDYDETHRFELADGISACELNTLSEFHLEVLKGDDRGGCAV